MSKENNTAGKPAARGGFVPPLALGAIAFLCGLFLGIVNVVDRVRGWFTPPALPNVTEEYLMLDTVEFADDLKSGLQYVASQRDGLQIIAPAWIDDFEAQRAAALAAFCENDASLSYQERSGSEVAHCYANAVPTVLIGTYAIRNADGGSLVDLHIETAVLDNDDGVVNAFDGFLSGQLSDDGTCFESDTAFEPCVARSVRAEVYEADLAQGETAMLPIFLSYQFIWMPEGDADPVYDGFAPTPFRFPVRVTLGDQVLIQQVRPMKETPTLRAGFYEGRG